MKHLKKFSDLLYETCQNFQKENNVLVHKITIEDNRIIFEIWSVKSDDGTILIKKYNYDKKRKKNNKRL